MVNPSGAPPELRIEVEGADMHASAAVPTLRFPLRIETTEGVPMRSLTLETRIDVAAPRRAYDAGEKERLVELFGEPEQWSTSLRNLHWTHTTMSVPAFTGSTHVDMLVGCTYDFDVAVVKYFEALRKREIPLEFLFSGAMFYTGDGGFLQIARISWETESRFRMPIDVWRKMIDHYFSDSAWTKLSKGTMDRLYAYKANNTLQTLDDAVNALLNESTTREMGW